MLLFAGPRFLLAKDGLLTAVWGLWFLATIRFRRPTAFVMARPFMEGRHAFSADPKMILRCAGGSGPLPVMWLGPAGGGRRRAEAGGGGRSGGWLEGDGVAEGFEFGDEPAGLPFGVPAAGEVVGAKFVVGLSSSQDVPVR